MDIVEKILTDINEMIDYNYMHVIDIDNESKYHINVNVLAESVRALSLIAKGDCINVQLSELGLATIVQNYINCVRYATRLIEENERLKNTRYRRNYDKASLGDTITNTTEVNVVGGEMGIIGKVSLDDAVIDKKEVVEVPKKLIKAKPALKVTGAERDYIVGLYNNGQGFSYYKIASLIVEIDSTGREVPKYTKETIRNILIDEKVYMGRTHISGTKRGD